MNYNRRNKILNILSIILIIGVISLNIYMASDSLEESEPIVENNTETVTYTETETVTVRGAISLPYVPENVTCPI